MLPKYHIIIGALASLLLYYIIPLTLIQTAIIFLSSFLIDIDHYIIYIIMHKDWSLKNAQKHFFNMREKGIKTSVEERKKYKRYIFIFHGIEFWLVLLIISKYIPLIIFVLYGFAIHIFLDYIDCIYFKEP